MLPPGLREGPGQWTLWEGGCSNMLQSLHC